MAEVEGTVFGHRDGHGFLVREGGLPDLYLSPQEMRAVLHRDRVKARIVRYDKKGRPEGRVLEIIERKKAPIIGRLLHESGIWLVAPEDKRYGQDIIVPRNAVAGAKAGQVVAIELTEPPSLHSQPLGRVTEVLGEIDDPGMEIEIAVRKYEVPHVFSEATLAQAAALPDTVGAADKKGRIDLTDVPLVTIDGEDARDFDDAVYCEPAKVGRGKGWRLVVAIADVSHYVKPGEPLDADAYERATSVYFPRRVIPMLPEKISNGLCSLNPEVDRLAMVCDMLVTSDGEIHAYQFFPAVIRSAARFTYTEVAAILANTRGPEAARREALVPHLLDLHDVYRALLKARVKRGAIDFETTETQILCDENGRIDKIVPRTRTEAHRLIEESMLAANVCSADFIARAKHPALYRVHEGPTPEKKTLLQNYLKALGLGLAIGDDPKPAEFQAIAQATKDRPDAAQIHSMLLRSMQQAIYTGTNSGHFGLAYEAYTHFTSPIRRYPDLLVHRVIKALIGGQPLPARLTRRQHPAGARQGGQGGEGGQGRQGSARACRRRRCWCPAASSSPGKSPARIAAPTSAAPTRPRATSRPGSSAATCASTSARSTAARSARSPASACSSPSTASTSRAWCTSPSSAASTSASTRSSRSCAASAPACATSSAAGSGCRSAGSTSTAARSTSAWSARARSSPLPRAKRDKALANEAATSEIDALKQADRAVKAATKAKSKARARSGAALLPSRAGKSATRKSGARGSPRGATRR